MCRWRVIDSTSSLIVFRRSILPSLAMTKKQRFYAVAKGASVGVFTSLLFSLSFDLTGRREYERSLRGCRQGVGKGFSTRRAAVKFISRYALQHESAGSLSHVGPNENSGTMRRSSSSVPPQESQQNTSGLETENSMSAHQRALPRNVSRDSSTSFQTDEDIEPPFCNFVGGKCPWTMFT
jgi:hypothetical protein